MFTHHGKSRTYKHNLQIASLLSFIAGIINVVGFLSVKRLTTNVTGHFAFFVDEVFKLDLHQSVIFFLYIFFFFMGSFVSSLLIEVTNQKNSRFIFIIPAIIESAILFYLAIFGSALMLDNADSIAFSLLFAMGLQNALVTRISDTVVRTTHLTGLFTDLGIELSRLSFYNLPKERQKLRTKIKLHLTVIAFFFIGGITGGILYSRFEIKALFLPAASLIIGLVYDVITYKIIVQTRKLRFHQKN